MGQLNPTRLDLARRRRGTKKTELAAAIGVTPRMLNQYERGGTEASDHVIEKMAEVLGFPVDFLTGEDIEEPDPEGVSFRSLKSMTAAQQHQAIGSASLAVVFDDWITEQFDRPGPDIPRYDSTSADPELAAAGVREAWGIGERRITNVVHLLERHGVRVFSLVEDCRAVDAFSFWRRGRPYVFVNTVKTAEHGRMDCAHELGHLVLHSHGGPRGRIAEDDAQAFAAAFLMPTRDILATMRRGATVKQILRAKVRWGVSAMALTHRLRRLELLTEWEARRAYMQLGRLGYRESEPNGAVRETSQVLDKVFTSLRDEGWTRKTVGNKLGIPPDDVNRFTFGLLLTNGGGQEAPAARPTLRLVDGGPSPLNPRSA